MKENKKLMLFTHSDLDGFGCLCLANLLSKNSLYNNYTDFNFEICNYDDVDKKVVDFFNSTDFKNDEDGYQVYITDISVNEETAELINSTLKDVGIDKLTVKLYDHHKTSTWLGLRYHWCVTIEESWVPDKYGNIFNKRKTCGTELFFNHEFINRVLERNLIKNSEEFVELVRYYDTWDWKREDVLEAKRLNNFFSNFDKRLYFVDNICSKLVLPEEKFKIFTDAENWFLDQKQKEIEEYILEKEKTMSIENETIDGIDYRFGLIELDEPKNVSELGNHVADKYIDEIDFVMIKSKNVNAISLRASDKNDIDVSIIAKAFGGGGHKKAAGYILD